MKRPKASGPNRVAESFCVTVGSRSLSTRICAEKIYVTDVPQRAHHVRETHVCRGRVLRDPVSIFAAFRL